MYFPIGDMHGSCDIHRKLYNKIVQKISQGIDPAFGGTIVFLGDYIDRGPDSKKVLDWLMTIKNFKINGHKVNHKFIRGNHEQFVIEICKPDNKYSNKTIIGNWLCNGGAETLQSFDCTINDLLDGKLDAYVNWIRALPRTFTDPDYVFVHAGIDRYQPIKKQVDFHTMWAFDRNHEAYKGYNRVIVHGHMVKKAGPIIDLPNNRIWMDVGAHSYGRAATVCLPEPFDYGYEPDGPNYDIIEVIG